MAAAVMFGAVACSQSDEIQEVVGGEEVVSVLSLELEDLGTRLAGDAGKIDRVAWGIYDEAGNFLAPHSSEVKGVANFTGGKAEIEVRLFTGKVYDLVFFAYCSANEAYSINWGERQLNVNYDDLANLEARDAFFHIENGFVAGPNKTFTLKRPFAQLNAGQSMVDYDNMQLTDNCIIKSQLTAEAYAAMDLKTGKVVGDKVPVVLDMNKVIDLNEDGANDHLIVGETEYKHLAMNYLLVNEKELVDVKLELLGNEDTKFVRDYYNVPLQRNYRTNILGSLISEPSVFTILIDAEFDGDNVYEVTPWDGKSVSEPEYDAATKTYTVSNGAELAWIAQTVNGTSTTAANPLEGQTIILANDINLGDYPWTPIGSAKSDHGFMANFDGNGHAVKNLNISNITPDADGYVYAGLFGVTEGTAANHNYIKNLIIENVNINVEGDIAAAAVAYPYYTDLDNITVKGKINIVARDYTAGVVSYTRRCVVASNLTIAGDEGSVISGRKTVGGVISDIQMNGGLTAQYTNFNASGLKITAEKSVGGISGIIGNQTLNGATVKNVQIVCGDIHKGKVAGSFGGKPVINDLVVENVTGAEFLVGANYDNNEDTIIVINGKEYIYKGNGTYLVDGVYETSTLEGLQNILNNAAGETVINLVADLNGDVTVAQSAGVKITINGNNHNYKGVIVVDGKSATYTTAALTINNVNFNAEAISADACIRLGNGTNASRYTCNVTVNGCTFDVAGAVGVKSYTGGDKNLKVLNSTAEAKAHSLLQAKGIDGILVEGCVIKSKNGLNFNNSTNVTVEQCLADVKGYAVRFGEGSAANGASETYTIENSSLKSACEEAGDAVIVLRGTADKAVLNLVNTTLEGTNQIANNANAVVIIDGVANITDKVALALVLASKVENTQINLEANGDYDAITAGELNNVTINGNGAVMTFVTDANSKLEDVTLNGVKFEYTGATTDFGIVINANAKIENLVVDGCSFVGTGEKKGRGIYGQNSTANIELKNCNFEKLGYPIYTMAGGGYESLVIEGCTFENIKSWAIMPQYNDYTGDLTVTGCTFKDCLGGGLVKAGKFTANHTFTFTNNTITGCTIAGDHNWFSINTADASKVVSGNTKDGVAWAPADAEGLK